MLSDGKHKPGSGKMGYYALKFLFTTLRRFYNEYKPKHYLFEGLGGKATHLSASAIREIYNKAGCDLPA
ncbi:MAG: hypothetical protein U9R19_13840 [Bacteroidota bacterium]|nr:hypothetical protein [Bacteroidota bacterium]